MEIELEQIANRLTTNIDQLYRDPRVLNSMQAMVSLMQLCLTDVPRLIGQCLEHETTIAALQAEILDLRTRLGIVPAEPVLPPHEATVPFVITP